MYIPPSHLASLLQGSKRPYWGDDDDEKKKEDDKKAAAEEKEDPKLDDRMALQQRGHFFLVGGINDGSCEKVALAMLRQAEANAAQRSSRKKLERFRLHITSGGGSVYSLFFLTSIIEQLREEFTMPVDTYMRGEAASAACVLSQYGERRYAYPGTSIMLHGPSWLSYGQEHDHDDYRTAVLHLKREVAELFARRNTSGDPIHNEPRWWVENCMSGRDRWWTPDEALQLGIIDVMAGREGSGRYYL
jgi:ATP-dependent protease ClpP protease subunit